MYITLCGKKQEETETERERQRETCLPWMSITVEMSADLEPISVSPKVLTKWRVFRFWFRLRWENSPTFFGYDAEEGWGRGDDTFRAYLISPWQRSQTAWLDLTLRLQYINYLCICNPSRNPFWFSYSPQCTVWVRTPLYCIYLWVPHQFCYECSAAAVGAKIAANL